MLRSLRSLAKTPLNKSNKFDWKPYRLEVYGPPPERIDAVIKDASRVAHTYIPPRTDNEVAERPLDVFPVMEGIDVDEDSLGNKKFTVVGPKPRVAKVSNGVSMGAGGRKTAEAQAVVSMAKGGKGTGVLAINKKSVAQYFPLYSDREKVLEPLLVSETVCDMDCKVTVRGGGKVAQASAVKLAIGRALQNFDPAYRWSLKLAGCLERDSRQVERKKQGQPKARKKKQWSKR